MFIGYPLKHRDKGSGVRWGGMGVGVTEDERNPETKRETETIEKGTVECMVVELWEVWADLKPSYPLSPQPLASFFLYLH